MAELDPLGAGADGLEDHRSIQLRNMPMPGCDPEPFALRPIRVSKSACSLRPQSVPWGASTHHAPGQSAFGAVCSRPGSRQRRRTLASAPPGSLFSTLPAEAPSSPRTAALGHQKPGKPSMHAPMLKPHYMLPVAAGADERRVRAFRYKSPHEDPAFLTSRCLAIQRVSQQIVQVAAMTRSHKSNLNIFRQAMRGEGAAPRQCPKSAPPQRRPPDEDRVALNIAHAWSTVPCVARAQHMEHLHRQQLRQQLAAERKQQLWDEWIERKKNDKEERLRLLRRAREQAEQQQLQQTATFWLAALWANAAQQSLGQVVIKAREYTKRLARCRHQIIRIQATMRMLIARRRYDRMRVASRVIQRGVRRFLKVLYVMRRREAAERIIQFLQAANKRQKVSHAFHRLVRCIETLRTGIRQYCLMRDARVAVIAMQWQRWEKETHRRIQGEIKFAGRAMAFEAADSCIKDTEFVLVDPAVQLEVCRQHYKSKMRHLLSEKRNREAERQRLCVKHQIDVLLERCYLLAVAPEDDAKFQEAKARVEAELPELDSWRVIEPRIVISRLHRQGMRIQAQRPGQGAPPEAIASAA